MNKKIIIPLLALTILGSSIYAAGVVQAEDTPQGPGYSSIITKLVAKFNLNEEEVKAVFDSERQERETEMETKRQEELNKLVTDGKITEEQKQLIIAKQKELGDQMQANRESEKDLSREDRQKLQQTRMEELKAWAQTNGIDEQYLHFGGRGGPGGPGGPKDKPTE